MLPMTGGDPEFAIVNIGRYHFLESPPTILGLNEINQTVINVGPFRQEEAAAWTELMEEEQLVILIQKKEREDKEKQC